MGWGAEIMNPDTGTTQVLGRGLQRIIATGVTGTTNGSVAVPNFDTSNDANGNPRGFIVVIPEGAVGGDVAYGPNVTFANGRLTWDFGATPSQPTSPGGGLNNNLFQFTFLDTAPFGATGSFPIDFRRTSVRYYLIATGGTSSENFGAAFYDESGETVIDSNFRCLAVQRLRVNDPANNSDAPNTNAFSLPGGAPLGVTTNYNYRYDSTPLMNNRVPINFDRDSLFQLDQIPLGNSLVNTRDRLTRTVFNGTTGVTRSSALIGVRDSLPTDYVYGVAIYDEAGEIAFAGVDFYPQVVRSGVASIPINGGSFSMTITHPAVTNPYYYFYVPFSPALWGVFTGSGGNFSIPCMRAVSATETRIEFQSYATWTASNFTFQGTQNSSISPGRSVNAYWGILEMDGVGATEFNL